ncbi:MAG: preprotein translocase subunit SecE [Gammaproteobacteria bacterium]|nr:MAG: preprotein translocase subunit SecE [Gammaproteobacteria bacterium]
MNTNAEVEPSKLDSLKWVAALVFFAAGVGGNVYFSTEPLLYRIVGVVVLSLVAIFIGLQTEQGKSFSDFFKAARVELKKIVWPTQQETLQSTIAVVLVVFVMSLLLWGLDSLLSFSVKLLLG